MKTTTGYFDNIWQKCPDALCYTANGCVTGNGFAVMGAGTASAALRLLQQSKVIEKQVLALADKIKYSEELTKAFCLAKVGALITRYGNVTQVVLEEPLFKSTGAMRERCLVSLPTKRGDVFVRKDTEDTLLDAYRNRFHIPGIVPGWALKTPVDLVHSSILDLVRLADINGWMEVFLPFPGGGAGELTHEERVSVNDILRSLLDDRFTIFTLPNKK